MIRGNLLICNLCFLLAKLMCGHPVCLHCSYSIKKPKKKGKKKV